MASSYGEDASKEALAAHYLRVLPTSSLSANASEDILNQLFLLQEWIQASVVLLPAQDQAGVSMKELARRSLEAGKRVGRAFTQADKTDFVEIFTATDIDLTCSHVPVSLAVQTEGDTLSFSLSDLIGSLCVVPGLVFDGQGYRVGKDDESLDAFLAFYPGHKIALVQSLQISSNPLPHDAAQIPVDVLVTEHSAWHCR